MQEIHPGQHLVARVDRTKDAGKDRARAADDRRGQHRRDHEVADQAAAVDSQRAADRAGAEQGDGDGMHRGDQRADARVDHAGREEELKRVGGDAEQVEQERNRGIEAAEERQQPGQRQPRIVGHGERRHRQTSRRTG